MSLFEILGVALRAPSFSGAEEKPTVRNRVFLLTVKYLQLADTTMDRYLQDPFSDYKECEFFDSAAVRTVVRDCTFDVKKSFSC